MTGNHQRIRVLIVGPSLDIVGGQAVQAKRLLDGLADNELIDASFLPVNPRLSGIWGAAQRIKYVRTLVTSIAYFFALVRRIPKCDIVHAFSASYFSYLLAPLPAMVVGKLFGKETLLNYHSGEADDHLTRWRLTAKPTMRRLADLIVVPSAYLVDVFGKHGMRALVASNSIPVEKLNYRRRENFAPRFLSNRNHEELYNVACTIRAFGLVKEKYPTALLTVVGDGAKHQQLKELAAELGIQDAVRFTGRVAPEMMGRYYDEADIYLNSPNIDNMPLSIVESFACGLPVVSTDAGGIPYMVDHGRTGLLTPCDDHHALAASALCILSDQALASTLATNARKECESRYVWSAVQVRWEQVYSEMVDGRP